MQQLSAGEIVCRDRTLSKLFDGWFYDLKAALSDDDFRNLLVGKLLFERWLGENPRRHKEDRQHEGE